MMKKKNMKKNYLPEHKYILKGKKPVVCRDVMKWAKWFEKSSEIRIVKQDKIGKFMVSTVFLGLDHSYGGGKKILFETMVFNNKMVGELFMRYATWKEAERGHKLAVITLGVSKKR